MKQTQNIRNIICGIILKIIPLVQSSTLHILHFVELHDPFKIMDTKEDRVAGNSTREIILPLMLYLIESNIFT